MNLKTLLAFATVTASTAVLAEVVSTTALCRIKVDSGTKNTIVALPLIKVGGTTQTIPVSEFVMTDNLTDGDSILVMDATGKTTTQTWSLVEDDQTHVKSWQSGTVVEGTDSTTAPAASTAGQARGSAIWLTRKDPAKPFYLYGQVSETEYTQPEIGNGTPESPAYTFIGNPNPKEIKLNDPRDVEWVNAQVGDQIIVGSTGKLGYITYTYGKSENGVAEWVCYTASNGDVTRNTDITLPAGQGFWYVTTSTPEGGRTRSITWE